MIYVIAFASVLVAVYLSVLNQIWATFFCDNLIAVMDHFLCFSRIDKISFSFGFVWYPTSTLSLVNCLKMHMNMCVL